MLISIIGTSNSIIKGGYVDALSSRCTVVNYSSGRNSVLHHITEITKNYKRILSSDLIIIDHSVNDINFYHERVKDYQLHVENLYKIISSTNVECINILFPMRQLSSSGRVYCDHLKEKSLIHGISVIDLNDCGFKAPHFLDTVHLIPSIAYYFGISLLKFIDKEPSNNFGSGELVFNPYEFLGANQLVEKVVPETPQAKIGEFSNSLRTEKYIELERENVIIFSDPISLASISYYNLVDEFASVVLEFVDKSSESNSVSYLLVGDKYYNETFPEIICCVKIFQDLQHSRMQPPGLMRRKNKETSLLSKLKIVGITCFAGEDVKFTPSGFQGVEIKFSNLLSDVEMMGLARGLGKKDINFLRSAAISMHEYDTDISKRLAKIVLRYRKKAHKMKSIVEGED
ncbi:hypothetical protein IEI94_10225 [Halomonas sp. ML-15]|uniref:hypothetical protein n=1 Tax=Halomonas sp. ML-15 TaxID=2773305 RepID=UPI0017469EB7|nr:hypothetical protein [Halomonas sp. ML-15]MBD3896225.1 hypothetical protein [Halomonas sp. ML-15]